jgi:hypothetical protein
MREVKTCVPNEGLQRYGLQYYVGRQKASPE